MADEYIKQRMLQWADWVMKRESGGLGYPRECPYTRMRGGNSAGYYSPDVDLEAMEVEKGVQLLPVDIKRCVREYYLRIGTIESKAKRLHIHRDTIYARIERAHGFILLCIESNKRQKTAKTC